MSSARHGLQGQARPARLQRPSKPPSCLDRPISVCKNKRCRRLAHRGALERGRVLGLFASPIARPGSKADGLGPNVHGCGLSWTDRLFLHARECRAAERVFHPVFIAQSAQAKARPSAVSRGQGHQPYAFSSQAISNHEENRNERESSALESEDYLKLRAEAEACRAADAHCLAERRLSFFFLHRLAFPHCSPWIQG